MKAIKKSRLCDSVTDALKKMIQEENFEPGDKFYSENELKKILGVSRSSVREAIRILEVTGQVSVKQGKGIFISDVSSFNFQPFINWLKNNQQSIVENFEVRLIIEPRAAAFAAQKSDSKDLKKLESFLVDFSENAKCHDVVKLIRSDRQFHRYLAGATKNNTLHMLMKSMTTSLPNAWITSMHTPGRIEKTIHEHRAIFEAVKKHDSSAAEAAMCLHLENALAEINSHLKAHL